ncbi:MAG: WG repeat-containing protein [Sphingomonadaceae bacterium]
MVRLLVAVAGLIASTSAIAAQSSPTVQSGVFGDERLILAADTDSATLSGYYREGHCRVFFQGALQPVTQYQRPDLGESYEIQSWDPRKPEAVFTTTLYSRARGGFNDQITLEPEPDDANRPSACPWRISLDRAGHVGNSLIGVGVVARSHPQLFELEAAGDTLRPVSAGRAKLERDSGVWVTKTYGMAGSPPGMIRITWYDPPGTPRGGYVRAGDLYPLSSAVGTESPHLPCTTLKDGAFEQLGDCARRNPDGSYAIVPDTLGQLDFDRWGLASLAIRGEGYAYVRHDGRALVVPTFDNAPDEFIGGLVRVRIDGKIGYANHHLKLVIPAIHDGAHRFAKDGRAWACTGCETVSDGEHSFYRGGTAVCLDRRGRQRSAAECGNAGWLPPQLRE